MAHWRPVRAGSGAGTSGGWAMSTVDETRRPDTVRRPPAAAPRSRWTAMRWSPPTTGRARWAPDAGWAGPLVEVVRARGRSASSSAALRGRRRSGPGRAARRVRPLGGDPRRPAGRAHGIVQLRDAFDEQHLRAAVDAVADSTFVIEAGGANRWRSARLRDRSGVSDAEAARSPGRGADPPGGPPAGVRGVRVDRGRAAHRRRVPLAGRRRRRSVGDHRDHGVEPPRPRGARTATSCRCATSTRGARSRPR